jgi:hypothetical protein
MRRTWPLLFAALICPASATPPPPAATFAEKACGADSIVVGEASSFKVVRVPGCRYRGNGRILSVCEEVQVKVSVREVLRPGAGGPNRAFVYRFGGGQFNLEELRKDLLSGPLYFFLSLPTGNRPPVYRTSYPWFLGISANSENAAAVRATLDSCPAANISSKPTPLRGAA